MTICALHIHFNSITLGPTDLPPLLGTKNEASRDVFKRPEGLLAPLWWEPGSGLVGKWYGVMISEMREVSSSASRSRRELTSRNTDDNIPFLGRTKSSIRIQVSRLCSHWALCKSYFSVRRTSLSASAYVFLSENHLPLCDILYPAGKFDGLQTMYIYMHQWSHQLWNGNALTAYSLAIDLMTLPEAQEPYMKHFVGFCIFCKPPPSGE